MDATTPHVTPLVLLILDGWGLRDKADGNAIDLGHPAYYESLLQRCPWVPLEASGEAVGLPEGQIGNSEVGHLNIGAGRVVYQELTRINKAIRDTSFFSNNALLAAITHVKQHNSTLHLMGLCSDGGVHSSLEHLIALIEMARDEGVEQLRIHAFLDGRDVLPKSAEAPLRLVEETLLDLGYPQIATICGRYYAMDRDNRWDRVQLAYDNLTLANGHRSLFSLDGLAWAYRQDETDEFVKPQVTDVTFQGIQDNDSLIFFNFRPDRARHMTRAMADAAFKGFKREKVIQNLNLTTMTPYDAAFPLPVAYPKQPMTHLLGGMVSEAGLLQFRTAETEKYAHVTYFFNGGIEAPYPGEERQLVASPQVATYDLQPAMSLPAVVDTLVNAIQTKHYGLLIANFANPDMVGHTGKLNAAIEAVKVTDDGIRQVAEAVQALGGTLLITADHGNVECMVTEDGQSEHTAHTLAPVPFIMVTPDASKTLKHLPGAALANIAPTILALLGLSIPKEMTADSLLIADGSPAVPSSLPPTVCGKVS